MRLMKCEFNGRRYFIGGDMVGFYESFGDVKFYKEGGYGLADYFEYYI